VPGLIDSHVHVTGGGGEAGPATRVPPIVLSALATAGVTSCVGVLGTDTTTRTMESLVARTLGLRAEGLSAWCWTGGYQVPPRTLTKSVRDDIVFIDPIIGVGELAISDHRSSQPTFDEFLRIAADCHVAGLMSGKAGVLHLHLGDGTRGLELVRRALDTSELPGRVFHPTHVNRQPRLFDEAISLAGRGACFDVTAFPPDDADPALPAANAIEAWLDAKLPAGRLTCSSDGAGCLPVFDGDGQLVSMDVGKPATLAQTLATLLRRRDASEVLPFFTSNVATQLRLAGKGRIAEGADADLVVLDDAGMPRDVMARGTWLVRRGVSVVRGPFETSEEK
jgi:beta-aspartyl-dipeptidase (metallo-type)